MSSLEGNRILVTGGTGFVGSHLVEELVKHGAEVVVTYQTFSHRSYFASKSLQQKVDMMCLDIANFEGLFDLVAKKGIELIYHLAAQPLVEVTYKNPRRTLLSSFVGTVNVLECARLTSDVKGVIAASSDKAYGKLKKKQFVETDPLRGDHPYEVSKSSADMVALAYHKTYSVPAVVTRFGNIYGEGDLHFERIVPGAMKALAVKKRLIIRSDGTYIRDYIYVKDVVRGYIKLGTHLKEVVGEAFNFGSEDTLSVMGLLGFIENTVGEKIDYKVKNIAKNEIHRQSLDYSKIKKRLGWQPQYRLRDVIGEIKEWYEKYFEE